MKSLLEFINKFLKNSGKPCKDLKLHNVYRHKDNENKPLRLITGQINDTSYQYKRINSNTGRQSFRKHVGSINFLLENYDCIGQQGFFGA